MISVAVLHDSRVEAERVELLVSTIRLAFSEEPSLKCETFAVSTGPSVFRAIRHINAGKFTFAVNACEGGNEEENAASPILVSLLLEQHGVPYTGPRFDTLTYSLDIVLMMLWYAGVPLPRFRVVRTEDDIATALHGMHHPIEVRPASAWCQDVGPHTQDFDILNDTALREAFKACGPLVLWESRTGCDTYETVKVFVCNAIMKREEQSEPVVVVTASETIRGHSNWPALECKLQEWSRSVLKNLLYDVGCARLCFSVRSGALNDSSDFSSGEDCQLGDVSFHPRFFSLLDSKQTRIIEVLCREAMEVAPQSTFSIQLHEDSRKGYRLCASKRISAGEIVFEDEGRSFAVVTRPHVLAHWSSEMKRVFSEYAWPLDSEGHAYAIWEKHPSRWRPINHSCDPNCIFAAPHSLNVIASRNIEKGEDLTMDYATFCDGTMKPFECLCGTSSCRGWVQADKESLAKYGHHAWFRKVPAPVHPIV